MSPTGDLDSHLSLEQQLREACLWEVFSPKPGNVHPAAAFRDMTWCDFVRSAHAAAPPLARARESGVGAAVRAAIQATRAVTAVNTNLGLALLLAPLAAVPAHLSLEQGLEPVLARLDLADSHAVYQAIALTQPGGLGRVNRGDVTTGPTGTLREMMALAAGHDAIAAEYAQGFPRVLQVGVPSLQRWQAHGPATAVVATQLELLTRCPDSLIARKCGAPLADEASQRASEVLAAGWPHTRTGQVALAEFDRWLRADGHRRNPGTTADLVGASLFAFFRDDQPGWPPCPLAELSDA